MRVSWASLRSGWRLRLPHSCLSRLQHLCPCVGCVGVLRSGFVSLLLLVPFVCFVLRLAPMLASRWVVTALRWYVASCPFIGIVSQGLASPCISDLSVSPRTKTEPVVGFADGRKKNVVLQPRFGRKRCTGWPLLTLNTRCSTVWLR